VGGRGTFGCVSGKHSAGILLYRLAGGAPEVLLVHPGGPYWARRDLGAWTIPKGELEAGETAADCALRELAEELGAAPTIAAEDLAPLGSVRQRSGKVVEAWAAEADFDPALLRSNTFMLEWPPRGGSEQEFPEVDRAEWFAPERARQKILPAQAPLLNRLLEHLG
jgi:predicted NUDIX family NTP pyrophosphohydrolase